MNSILVVGETEHEALTKSTLEALSAAHSITAGTIEVIVFTNEPFDTSKLLKKGADVVFITDPSLLVHQKVDLIVKTATDRGSSCLIATKDFGGGLMNQVAYRLGTALAHDCNSLSLSEDDHVIATRPVYGGNAIAEIKCLSEPFIISLRNGAFTQFNQENGPSPEYISLVGEKVSDKRTIEVIEHHTHSMHGIKLEDARVVVSGGRGIGGPDSFEQLESLAAIFNGAVGASRAACDAGWVPHSYQVGLTGKIVNPDLYFAIGISGASQHLAGITGARAIVSINKDANAAIFKESRFGVVGDWTQVLPAFMEQLHVLLGKTAEDK